MLRLVKNENGLLTKKYQSGVGLHSTFSLSGFYIFICSEGPDQPLHWSSSWTHHVVPHQGNPGL